MPKSLESFFDAVDRAAEQVTEALNEEPVPNGVMLVALLSIVILSIEATPNDHPKPAAILALLDAAHDVVNEVCSIHAGRAGRTH